MYPSDDHAITRRMFLQSAGAALAVGAATASAGQSPYVSAQAVDDLDQYDFVLTRVQFTEQGQRGQGKGPDVWNVRPGGDANLLRELARAVRCKVKPIRGAIDWEPTYARPGQLNAVVTLDKLEPLIRYPFLFMTGENHYQLSNNQKQNLKDFVTRGGFLLMDDCVVASGGDFFYRSSYATLEEMFGAGSVRMVPHEHEIFHNVYNLGETGLPTMEYIRRPGVPGRTPYLHGQNHGARGVFIGDRLAVFLSSTDLHCGWCDSHGIEWTRTGYTSAIQMGVNIVVYAMTH